MGKRKAKPEQDEYQPTEEDIQPVLMRVKELRDAVVAIRKDAHTATASFLFLWIVGELKEIERMTITARSGPGAVEELRAEGHDV